MLGLGSRYLTNYYLFSQMVDKHGISVLLAAIWEGHTDCVKTLLKNVSILHSNVYKLTYLVIIQVECHLKILYN